MNQHCLNGLNPRAHGVRYETSPSSIKSDWGFLIVDLPAATLGWFLRLTVTTRLFSLL